MKKKNKKNFNIFRYLIFAVPLILIFLITFINLKENIESQFVMTLKKFIPIELRVWLTEDFMSKNKLSKKNILLEELNRNLKLQIAVSNYNLNNVNKIEKKKIKLPFKKNYKYRPMPFFIERFKQSIILMSTYGEIIFIPNKIFNDNLEIKFIENNFLSFFNNKKTTPKVTDLLVIDSSLYVSFVKEVKRGCYNTSILKSELSLNKLIFKEFFSYKNCVNNKLMAKVNSPAIDTTWPLNKALKVNMILHGGRMVFDKARNKIIFTIGDYGARPLAQNSKNLFGKTISIDLKNKSHNILSIGHRNAQGLLYLDTAQKVVSTEHGPKGGDEINIIEKNKNYGWPISSYGKHYDGKNKVEAPLHKSHKKYGFEEPIFYFKECCLGISQLEIVPDYFRKGQEGMEIFVSTLKGRKIYRFLFDENLSKAKITEKINIGDRIRDFLIDRKNNIVFIALEDSVSLLVLFSKK